jgi:hypothetical protein
MNDRQVQKAGADSQQIQVSGDLIFHGGVTEERAREIATFAARKAIEEFTEEAKSVASARMENFDNRLVTLLAANDQLEAFADPAFHLMLTKAHLGAAGTDRETDLDMLTRLLSDRVERGEDRSTRASLNRAIEIVDQVDDEALRGLTVFHAILIVHPSGPSLAKGFDLMDRLFAQFLDGPLPLGNAWLDHLDLLDAVRTSQIGSLTSFSEYFSAKCNGFLATGVRKDSDAEIEANKRMNDAGITINLIEHELHPGYLRVVTANMAEFEKSVETIESEETREAFLQIAKNYYGLGAVDEEIRKLFLAEFVKRPNLCAIKDWWDQIPRSLQTTGAGRVLARANGKRLDDLGGFANLL